jgi:phosphoglucosamine mutase
VSRKYFGTDGIRGRVGKGPVTADFMLKLGWAAGKVFSEGAKNNGRSRSRIIIGKDTRISGYMFESALEAGLVAAGVDVILLGPMPTPAIAYLTRTFRAQAGIVISASHNPYQDNGIKFFSSKGAKLPDEVEIAIEARLDEPMTTVESSELGKVSRMEDAGGRYIEFCKSTVPSGMTLKGLNIVLDCAHGATYHVAPSVMKELGARVTSLGVNPDGLNINEKVGSTEPQSLQQAVKDSGADLGIAFDGDGDRVLFVDHQGEVVDGDELLFIIAQAGNEAGAACNGVVGTLMSNLGFEIALQERNIPFARAKVGDRYVIELMREKGWQLGGESSGHIICADATTTGDGVIAALKVLAALLASGKSLYELKQGMKKFPQTMVNVRLAKSVDMEQNDQVQDAVQKVTAKLGNRGRVLLRPSGTEPVVRVMVEGEDAGEVDQQAHQLADVVRAAVGV